MVPVLRESGSWMERIEQCHDEQPNRLPSQWDEWVSDSFDGLRKKHLVRELRPIIPTLQAMQVCARTRHASTAATWPAWQYNIARDRFHIFLE